MYRCECENEKQYRCEAVNLQHLLGLEGKQNVGHTTERCLKLRAFAKAALSNCRRTTETRRLCRRSRECAAETRSVVVAWQPKPSPLGEDVRDHTRRLPRFVANALPLKVKSINTIEPRVAACIIVESMNKQAVNGRVRAPAPTREESTATAGPTADQLFSHSTSPQRHLASASSCITAQRAAQNGSPDDAQAHQPL
ncbi:hypothetical protein TCAP_00803 [Tolypocladium capitatum]|uniref:Uncharacterized protein n=1 Tax=Tolypocladium capitatum TaxID=45235 RepID=A0A2K3QP30_9HYPO|nr:hypothetical protein TCAP_00803 [Tolypocladium capitatum]